MCSTFQFGTGARDTGSIFAKNTKNQTPERSVGDLWDEIEAVDLKKVIETNLADGQPYSPKPNKVELLSVASDDSSPIKSHLKAESLNSTIVDSPQKNFHEIVRN